MVLEKSIRLVAWTCSNWLKSRKEWFFRGRRTLRFFYSPFGEKNFLFPAFEPETSFVRDSTLIKEGRRKEWWALASNQRENNQRSTPKTMTGNPAVSYCRTPNFLRNDFVIYICIPTHENAHMGKLFLHRPHTKRKKRLQTCINLI